LGGGKEKIIWKTHPGKTSSGEQTRVTPAWTRGRNINQTGNLKEKSEKEPGGLRMRRKTALQHRNRIEKAVK